MRGIVTVGVCLLLVASACANSEKSSDPTLSSGPPEIEVRAGDQTAILDPFHFCWNTPEGDMCVYGIPPDPLPDLGTINDRFEFTFPVEGFVFHADFTPVPAPDCAYADCEGAWLGELDQTGPTSWRVMPPQLMGGWTVRLGGSGPAGDVFVEFAAETSIPVLSVEEAVESGPGGLVTVVGYVVAAAEQPVRICSALMESFPPQCAGASLVVAGFDFESLQGWSATGGDPTASSVTWTDTPVEVTGRINAGVLTVPGTAPPVTETTVVGGDDPNELEFPGGARDALVAHWDSLASDPGIEHRITQAWAGRSTAAGSGLEQPVEVWCVEAEISSTRDPSVDGSRMVWIVTRSAQKTSWTPALLASLSSTWPYEACGAEIPG